jgi:FAD/FMN-containing dehydrogenase
LRTELSALIDTATIMGERMPAALWDFMSRPASSTALADGVRRAFDPDHIMNTGILGGG